MNSLSNYRMRRMFHAVAVALSACAAFIAADVAQAASVTHRITGTFTTELDDFHILPAGGGTYEVQLTFDGATSDGFPTDPTWAVYNWGSPPAYGWALWLNSTQWVTSVSSTTGRGYVWDNHSSQDDRIDYQGFDAFNVRGTTYSFTDTGDLTRFLLVFLDNSATALSNDAFPTTPPGPTSMTLSSGGSIFQLRDSGVGESRIRFMTADSWSLLDDLAPTITGRSPAVGATLSTTAVNIDVTFSETVHGVDASDMVLTAAAAVGANVGTPSNPSGNTWRFPLSGLTNGALNITLAPDANDIEDLAGNDLAHVQWNYVVAIPSPDTNVVVITSFDHNGQLAWTDESTQGLHSVQWASSLTGTWHNTWEMLVNFSATGGTRTVKVPMFYRVIRTTTPVTP